MSAPQTGSIEAAIPGAALLAAALEGEALLRERMAVAGVDLARAPAFGIDDETRARAGLLIEAAIRAAETALRAAEPGLDAAPPFDLPVAFVRAGLLARSRLAATALLRAEEHRLTAALLRGAGEAEEGPAPRRLDPIGGDFAAESFAVRAAEAARLDRTGDPLLPLHDIPAEDRHALFWQVAACLAEAALAVQGEARAGNEDALHRAASAAVARMLAAIDDRDGIAPAAMRLAQSLAAVSQIDDALLGGALASGRIATFAALLASRAGIGFDDARAMLTDPARCAVLLRACDVERGMAAAMILAMTLALDRGFGAEPTDLAGDLVAEFAALPLDRARAEVRRTRLEPLYRDALAAAAAK
ncbi:MAG: hypothetical protein JWO65_1712 [Sphingomonas bacterium]|nr:hypothetical protein [Sphingomonas bacterium]